MVSLFYGLFAVKIFLGEETYKGLSNTKRAREIIFNFLGAAVGFLILYFLIRKAIYCVNAHEYKDENIIDILLLIIALIGISGYLPYTIFSLSNGIHKMLEKLKIK